MLEMSLWLGEMREGEMNRRKKAIKIFLGKVIAYGGYERKKNCLVRRTTDFFFAPQRCVSRWLSRICTCVLWAEYWSFHFIQFTKTRDSQKQLKSKCVLQAITPNVCFLSLCRTIVLDCCNHCKVGSILNELQNKAECKSLRQAQCKATWIQFNIMGWTIKSI